MIIGIGTDIVQIPRIERILDLYGQKFINRILSPTEVQKILTLNKQHYSNFLAKRFAAKEAVSKALGTGIGRVLSFKDISITNDDLGRPLVEIRPSLNLDKFGLNKFNQIEFHLSISDDYPTAIAFAVATAN